MSQTLTTLFIATAVSGVLPLLNAELLVLAAAAAVPASGLPLVALTAAAGQMLTKYLLFLLARHAPQRLPRRYVSRLEQAERSVARRRGATVSLVFASAATGLPPFYGVSLACGALRVRKRLFVLTGFAGRALRFGVLAGVGGVAWGAVSEIVASLLPVLPEIAS